MFKLDSYFWFSSSHHLQSFIQIIHYNQWRFYKKGLITHHLVKIDYNYEVVGWWLIDFRILRNLNYIYIFPLRMGEEIDVEKIISKLL